MTSAMSHRSRLSYPSRTYPSFSTSASHLIHHFRYTFFAGKLLDLRLVICLTHGLLLVSIDIVADSNVKVWASRELRIPAKHLHLRFPTVSHARATLNEDLAFVIKLATTLYS
ncbi:hypothetical protein P171DRAFT_480817 [Karstenula rhodostoma CBS 690.94]|uniref:Uncharacterized protein n=1 Tax=Karstenula rhodostoma CBS 690.94 TaxID=1392251 RepID=A0A9P4UF90_9PLEO|nr:hypothetical protein P171DRAFT_480817 [Karstenula rhodostoma CBS 690.94]